MTIPNYHWYYYDFDLLLTAFPLFGLALLARLAGRRLAMLRFGRGKGMRIAAMVVILVLAVMTIMAIYPLQRLGDYRSDNRLPAYVRILRWLEPRLKPGDIVLAIRDRHHRLPPSPRPDSRHQRHRHSGSHDRHGRRLRILRQPFPARVPGQKQ